MCIFGVGLGYNAALTDNNNIGNYIEIYQYLDERAHKRARDVGLLVV